MFVPFSAHEPPMRMMSGPPAALAPHVLEFCEGVCPGARPVYLAIRPGAGCAPNECFPNVRQKVEQEGGRIQFGWALDEWPYVFIEAIHHAVYEGPDGGPWVDITPPDPNDPQRTRLFLADDSAVYDFEKQERRDHIRLALTPDALIDEYLQLSIELNQVILSTPWFGTLPVPEHQRARVTFIVRRICVLKRQIATKYTPQGAPCFCGSGQKFKRCHGQAGRNS